MSKKNKKHIRSNKVSKGIQFDSTGMHEDDMPDLDAATESDDDRRAREFAQRAEEAAAEEAAEVVVVEKVKKKRERKAKVEAVAVEVVEAVEAVEVVEAVEAVVEEKAEISVRRIAALIRRMPGEARRELFAAKFGRPVPLTATVTLVASALGACGAEVIAHPSRSWRVERDEAWLVHPVPHAECSPAGRVTDRASRGGARPGRRSDQGVGRRRGAGRSHGDERQAQWDRSPRG
jgi:hypothetical protein